MDFPGLDLFLILKQLVGLHAQGVGNCKNGIQGNGAVGIFNAAQMIAADICGLA